MLPISFLDEVRARTPLAAVVGRRVKLARSGRQWKGCCPFHDEKTPSFYVYDDGGFHCFGCGANGDAIGFVMRAEGASFTEAVGRLAAEAGLEVPKPSPEAAAVERRRLDQHAILDAASAWFARRLRAPEGRPALDYLRGRGLSDTTIESFGLGWSGEGRGALAAELGVAPAVLAEIGLVGEAADGRPREMFYNRVILPIRDAQGRIISFGGRVLGDAQPKYLNGPETALFSKRRALFGLDRAREGLRGGARLVLVEGYFDVIALHQAGFVGAVAPLGTALTEGQLGVLWRLSPSLFIAFDGDVAGARAAERAIGLALPGLSPDNGVHFVRLGEHDPDSLIRARGAAAFAEALDQAQPLLDVLFRSLRQAAATPEQLAAFRGRLAAAAAAIRHPALAAEYRRALLDRFFAERRRPKGDRVAPRGTRAMPRPALSEARAEADRCRILLALALRHPQLLRDLEEAVAELPVPVALRPLQRSMLDWVRAAECLDSAELLNHLRASGCAGDAEALAAGLDASLPTGAREGASTAEARTIFCHFAGLLRRPGLAGELAQAREALARNFDEAAIRRVVALRAAQQADETGLDGAAP